MDQIKLFHAYAVVNGFRGHDRVTLFFYCTERCDRFDFYDRIVTGYSGLSERGKQHVKSSIDLLFTEQEIGMLRNYLEKRHAFSLNTLLEPMPVPAEKYLDRPGAEIFTLSGDSIWELGREGMNWLPFQVSAAYDLRYSPPVAEEEAEEPGKRKPIVLDKLDF